MGGSGNLKPVASWLWDNQSVEISRFEPVGGGCINETGVITLASDERLFVKMQTGAPPDFFAAEAHGLDCLRRETDLRIPRVIHVAERFLLLEDLGTGPAIRDFWRLLGEGLAQLHHRHHALFGLERDNYCGRTGQRNDPTADGYSFFANYRLNSLAERANQMGLLDTTDRIRVARLAGRLEDWIPPQPAVLIHGDLWSGNVHCDNRGCPALIDPACYRGWAEAELAMTQLFGGFSDEFYRAYEQASGIDSDWRERAPLYNLYHLLNHLILFGSSYLGQVRNIVARYG